MNSRHARYLAVGILVGSIALAAMQVPALVWLAAIAIAVLAVGAVVVSGLEQGSVTVISREPSAEQGEEATSEITPGADAATETDVLGPADPPVIAVEIVRVADEASATPTVWLHRSGGRRVHRFADGRGWTVQQVSTKDPDNPKKRIIGEPLSFTSEEEAIVGADNLAQGILPGDVDAAREYGVPPVAMAEARRRKVRLTGGEQARRLAGEWGVLAGA